MNPKSSPPPAPAPAGDVLREAGDASPTPPAPAGAGAIDQAKSDAAATPRSDQSDFGTNLIGFLH